MCLRKKRRVRVLKVILALFVVITVVGCEKIQTKIDLECKNGTLRYHYEQKVLFPFEYIKQSHKGVAVYSDNKEIIKCAR